MRRPDGPPAGSGLRELGRRYELPELAVDQLRKLIELVASDGLAPTSVRDPGKVLEDHIADSLVALELPELAAAGAVVDIGSGAGFPGLVLAIARPGSEVVLIESSSRKCEFIQRAAARCGLANARAVHARAEAWPAGIGRFDLATARALAPLAVVLEYASPLLRLGGSVVAWRGRRDRGAEAAAKRAAAKLGLSMGGVRRVAPYPAAAHRHLHLATKVAETPSGFPRRPGAARKRPLGALDSEPSDRSRR